MIKLSIIVPCYNCASTVEQAVESVFRQESLLPFDVTMVDDGSTDRTYNVLEALRARHPNVNVIRHASNRGGGAARNTAVANSDGEIILCLDSDNMLGPNVLRRMTGFWLDQQCDGLGISRSIKFRGSNIHDVAYADEFENPGKPVRLESLLDGTRCPLYSTLMYTRRAFAGLGGYPTHHGFDTQGFAIRFMYNGFTAYTCPGTVEYHRVGLPRSYYTREDRAGRVHWNMFRIFEEFLYLFRDEIKAQILGYDTFPDHQQSLLIDQLRAAEKQGSIYRDDFRTLIRLGRGGAAEALRGSESKFDRYWLGTYYQSCGRVTEAMDSFRDAIAAGFNFPIAYCELLEAGARLSHYESPLRISIGNLVYYTGAPHGSAGIGRAVAVRIYPV